MPAPVSKSPGVSMGAQADGSGAWGAATRDDGQAAPSARIFKHFSLSDKHFNRPNRPAATTHLSSVTVTIVFMEALTATPCR